MAETERNFCYSFVHGTLLTYSTVKLVKVPNTWIAILHRILQLIIVLYIIGYIVVWKKGYQQYQEPRGTSVIKVKGVATVAGTDTLFEIDKSNMEYIWDTPEYAIPPIESNAFFIATRQTVTYNQTQTVCATALADELPCDTNNTALCKKGKPLPNTFGYFTGECVRSKEDENRTVCEMKGWCPEELSDSTDYVINSTELESFTVFLKTMVTFTLFNKTLRNIQTNTSFFCRFDGTPDTIDCPIIPVGYILNQLNTNRTALLLEGGLIEIRQDWQCDFDYNPDKCIPTYEFAVLQSGDDKQSPGINYRFAQKYRKDDVDYRTLVKVYGLRFIVSITGKGGQFFIVSLFVAIGSGIGFMVIAGIVADTIFMYFHRSRTSFREGKFTIVDVENKDDKEMLVRPQPVFINE